MKSHKQRANLMLIPAVLGYLGVSISGIYTVEDPRQRIWAAGLLILFGLVYFFPTSKSAPRWIDHILMAVETILVAGLMSLQPGWSVFPILFFILSPQALVSFSQRTGLLWVGVFSLVTAVIFIARLGLIGLVSFLPYVAGYSFFAIFGWISAQAERERMRSERLLAELQDAHHQLQEYAARVEEWSIVQERNRIAREMHDALGHRLTIAAVQLEGAQRLVRSNPERSEQILGTVREQIREGLGELRNTVAMLRASMEEDLPLKQALTRLASQVQEATSLQVHLSLEDCPETLPAPYRQALYRAAQEGLTNIQRHARASDAWLRLSAGPDCQVTLLIGDNGTGFSAEESRSGYGLTGLKERAALLGGDFFIDPRPGGGAQLTFRLPLPAEKSMTHGSLDEQNCRS